MTIDRWRRCCARTRRMRPSRCASACSRSSRARRRRAPAARGGSRSSRCRGRARDRGRARARRASGDRSRSCAIVTASPARRRRHEHAGDAATAPPAVEHGRPRAARRATARSEPSAVAEGRGACAERRLVGTPSAAHRRLAPGARRRRRPARRGDHEARPASRPRSAATRSPSTTGRLRVAAACRIIELRVPAQNVKAALSRLAGLGTLVSQQLSVDDLEQRLRTQSEQIAQLRRRVAALRQALRDSALPEAQRVLLQIKLAESKRALAQRFNARKGTISAGTTARISLVIGTEKAIAPVPKPPRPPRPDAALGGRLPGARGDHRALRADRGQPARARRLLVWGLAAAVDRPAPRGLTSDGIAPVLLPPGSRRATRSAWRSWRRSSSCSRSCRRSSRRASGPTSPAARPQRLHDRELRALRRELTAIEVLRRRGARPKRMRQEREGAAAAQDDRRTGDGVQDRAADTQGSRAGRVHLRRPQRRPGPARSGVEGPARRATRRTPIIPPGGEAKLTVSLATATTRSTAASTRTASPAWKRSSPSADPRAERGRKGPVTCRARRSGRVAEGGALLRR